jgi:hypothetical protein
MIRIKAELDTSAPRRFAGDLKKTWAGAVRVAVEVATESLKRDIRDQILDAGLGARLANAVGSKLYPDKARETLHPAGVVAPRGKLATEIFDAFNAGVPIRARNRRYLAVPTKAARFAGSGGRRLSPDEFERRSGITLRVVKSKKSGALLLMGSRFRGKAKRGQKDLVYYVLVPMVRPGARLNFDALARRWADRIPDFIERALPEELR